MIKIKIATPEDAELIAGISRETFYDTYAAYNTKEDMDKFLSEQFTKEQLIAQVHDPENLFLLAYENNEPAGYVFLKAGSPPGLTAANALEIKRFYACTSFIGKGVGKALMQASIDHAKKENRESVWLIVWKQNFRAIKFYEAFGFAKIGEQEFILGNDVQNDWVMQLEVKS